MIHGCESCRKYSRQIKRFRFLLVFPFFRPHNTVDLGIGRGYVVGLRNANSIATSLLQVGTSLTSTYNIQAAENKAPSRAKVSEKRTRQIPSGLKRDKNYSRLRKLPGSRVLQRLTRNQMVNATTHSSPEDGQ